MRTAVALAFAGTLCLLSVSARAEEEYPCRIEVGPQDRFVVSAQNLAHKREGHPGFAISGNGESWVDSKGKKVVPFSVYVEGQCDDVRLKILTKPRDEEPKG